MDISADLTVSQMQVLILVSHGMTFDEDAGTLHYSPKTLAGIMTRLIARLGASLPII